jgi:hypothetical protein
MQVPVLVEKRSDGRFRVLGLGRGPLGWEAEGDSPGEAKESLRQRIEEAFLHDISFDTLDVRLPDAPSTEEFFGDLKGDPLFDEWQEAIREYRQERQAA